MKSKIAFGSKILKIRLSQSVMNKIQFKQIYLSIFYLLNFNSIIRDKNS